jgi:hypothetical protein
MTTATKTKWKILALAAGLGGIVLGQTGLAGAGTKWEWPVRIDGASPSEVASGSLLDGRFTGDPLDYIGCSYTTGGWIECYARQGLGPGLSKRVNCIVDSPSVGAVSTVSGLNAASVLRFQLKSGGLCNYIQIWNESDYL